MYLAKLFWIKSREAYYVRLEVHCDFAPPRARSIALLPTPAHPVGAAHTQGKRKPPTGASWNISGRAEQTAGASEPMWA